MQALIRIPRDFMASAMKMSSENNYRYGIFRICAGSIGVRLGLGFGLLMMITLGLAAGSVVEYKNLVSGMNQIVFVNNERTSLANGLLNSIDAMAIQSRSIALVVDITTLDNEIRIFDELLEQYQSAEAILQQNVTATRADEYSLSLLADIQAIGRRVLPGMKQAVKQGAESASVEAAQTLESVRPLETSWRRKVAQFAELQKANSAQAVAVAQASRNRAAVVGSVLLLVAVLAGSLVAVKITLGIQRSMENAVLVAERIAQGDLSTPLQVTGSDEIARLLKAMVSMQDRLRELVDQIRSSASMLQIASAEVAAGNADLSRRTEVAAAQLEETNASMSQLTGMVNRSTDAARRASGLASSAAVVAEKGGAIVSRVIGSMGEINVSSKRISEINGVIDVIAFQTNILALNAAVEAARAREHGKGFAVVAAEVRNLAQRCAASAREIKSLVSSSVARVEEGAQLVGDAGITMGHIVTHVERVVETIAEISAVASEQGSEIGRIHHAIIELDGMTQQNTALVEQGAAATEGLKDQANQLAGMVSIFKLAPA
ncbi:MAG: methyl-accepting chemotaxis protein [Acidovorax temperans]|uniref:methyl-accepting chemotaxis protein n=1 Tax=Acidovorax temperans TaxID=80878 RepID=UPI003918CA9E